MEAKAIQNPLEIHSKIDVEKWTSKKRPLVFKKLTKGSKSTAQVVDFGEGRDPREGGYGGRGGEIRPQVGKEGLRTKGGSEPLQPRGLVGFTSVIQIMY